MDLFIVYVDTKANKAEKMPLSYEGECHNITDGYHPTKLFVNSDSLGGDAARTLARKITATLKWELRLIIRDEKEKLLIVPTYEDEGYRRVATYYTSVEAHHAKPYLTFDTHEAAVAARKELQ